MNLIFVITISILGLNGFSPQLLHAASKTNVIQKLPSDLTQQSESDEVSPEKEFRLLCPICNENQVDTLFYPCHHITSCQECALRLHQCPQCRALVRRKVTPISLRFSTGEHQGLNDSRKEDFETLCTVCKDRPIDVLYSPCQHVNSCHECASQMRRCPQCSARIKKQVHPVFLSFMPEIRELQQDEFPDELHSQFRFDRETRLKMQKFIQDIKDPADLLAEIEHQSLHNNFMIRSGTEAVLRAQASVIFSLGLEVTFGRYTTSHFCGVPYLRLGWVSGTGAISATLSLSSRKYSRSTEKPSPDFTSIIRDHDLHTGALGVGSTLQDISGELELEERGIALGGLMSCADRGRTIVRIPLFLPTQRLSKKGRLLLKAKKLELKMLSLIRKNQWAELSQNTLPDYLETVEDLLTRVRRKNEIYRSHKALSAEHPFYSLENLYHATASDLENRE